MYIINVNRETLIQVLPTDTIGVEVGVEFGLFSENLLKVVRPRKLHLIDPWAHQDHETYNIDPTNVSDEEGNRRYEGVCERFMQYIDSGVVEIHREVSETASARFSCGYFDWVYIDAVHTYDGARGDLERFFPLVKEGGFILGHDFTNRAGAQAWNFGVVEAVTDFCGIHDCVPLAVTQEICPTFLLMKSHYKNYVVYREITRVIREQVGICFEVPDHLLPFVKHNEASGKNGLNCWFSLSGQTRH